MIEAPLVFPASDFDRPDAMSALFGTFWTGTFHGAPQVRDWCDAFGRLADRVFSLVEEAAACASLDATPLFHVEAWSPLTIAQSALVAATLASPSGTVAAFSVVVDPTLVDAPFLFDSQTSPTVSWCRGLDYDVVAGAIVFARNPFTATALVADVPPSGDQELTFWLYRPRYERHFLADRVGAAIGATGASSEAYRRYLQALWYTLVEGAATGRVARAAAAAVDAPSVLAGGETVAAIATDLRGTVVVTDRNAYRLPANSVALAHVGQTLDKDSLLCDAVALTTLGGTAPAGLTELFAPVSLPGDAAPRLLGFPVAATPLLTTVDSHGLTKASFALDGDPGDVSRFWDVVHARGVATGRTLARLLDVRGPAAATEPTAASLPATISPLAFLLANVWRDNAALLQIRADVRGPSAVGWSYSPIRRTTVPWVGIPGVASTAAVVDSATMGGTDVIATTTAYALTLTDTIPTGSSRTTLVARPPACRN